MENGKLEELMELVKREFIREIEKNYLGGIEKERFENAKRGCKEDKLFIYEKIKRIINNSFSKAVNYETIDSLLREYHVNYFENLYFDDDIDRDEDFDDNDLNIYKDKVDDKLMELFIQCNNKLLFKPSEDKDIIEIFKRYQITEYSSYSSKLDRLARIIYQSKWGFGAVEDFIDENEIFNDIGCNRWDYIWVQVKGKKRPLRKIRFKDQSDYVRVLRNIARYNGANDITPANPVMECSIKDMQRVTILVPPIVREGCEVLRVRNQALAHITLEEMVVRKSIGERFYKFIHLIKPGRPNIAVYGGQGIGKSTLINAMLEASPYYLVQATQESSHELHSDMRYPLKNIIGLQSIKGFGPGEIYTEKLRMCLDSDHYGEIRTAEDAYWAKQTLTRQCRGSFFTVHYEDPYSCIEGFAELICTYLNYHDHTAMRYSTAKMINFLIAPYKDNKTGKFYVKNVYEVVITDRENMRYEIRETFRYDLEKEDLVPVTPISQYTEQLLKNYDVSDKDLEEIGKLFVKDDM